MFLFRLASHQIRLTLEVDSTLVAEISATHARPVSMVF
jgi:hypothetical protein